MRTETLTPFLIIKKFLSNRRNHFSASALWKPLFGREMVSREEIYISVSRWKMGLIWPSNNSRKKSHRLCTHSRFLRNDNSAFNIPKCTRGKWDGGEGAPSQSEVTAGGLKERHRMLSRKNSCPVLWRIAGMASSVRWGIVGFAAVEV